MSRFVQEHMWAMLLIVVLFIFVVGLACGMKIGYAACMKQHAFISSAH